MHLSAGGGSARGRRLVRLVASAHKSAAVGSANWTNANLSRCWLCRTAVLPIPPADNGASKNPSSSLMNLRRISSTSSAKSTGKGNTSAATGASVKSRANAVARLIRGERVRMALEVHLDGAHIGHRSSAGNSSDQTPTGQLRALSTLTGRLSDEATDPPSSSGSSPKLAVDPVQTPNKDATATAQQQIDRIVKFKRVNLTKPGQSNRPSKVTLIDEYDAMHRYQLTTDDLVSLPSRIRRSSYFGEKPVRVLFEDDVYKKAVAVHGSSIAVDRIRQLQLIMQDPTDIRSPYHRKFRSVERQTETDDSKGLNSPSGKVVRWAVLMNSMDATGKYVGWWLTGSSSMFAEAMHASADTLNQIVLAAGIQTGAWKPTQKFPYGFGQMRYVTSLISGVGIFFIGCGFSLYHGFEALLFPPEAFYILTMSFLFQSSSAYKALSEIRTRAAAENVSVRQYFQSHRDPSVNVVLMEDSAAVLGVLIAFSAIMTTTLTGSPVPDALGSIAIGTLMGGVASHIIRENTTALVGQSLPRIERDRLVQKLENDDVITSVHDVKVMSIGPGQIRLKAEVDFDGAMITDAYLKKHNLTDLKDQLQSIENEDDLRECFYELGEGIIDQLGEEIDRVEGELKKLNPRIRHIDLEAL